MINKTVLIRFYFFISALVVLDVGLYIFSQMSFVGYWSDRVIFWIWFFTTPFIIFSYWKKLIAKIYFYLLVAGLLLSILPMAIPFFGIFLSTTGRGRLNHFSLKDNFRVQSVGYGVMGKPRLQIVKDGLLFDKIMLEDVDEIKKNDTTSLELRSAKNARLIAKSDTSITVKYFFENETQDAIHVFKEKKGFNY
ncbi:hypothetical protein [Pedobacter sp. Leaf250]|nr:hypothetical protein [Pedobacter sp. Leaf250]